MKILIFSHLNGFGDGEQSLHPGFTVGGVTLIMTHTKPWNRNYITIPAHLLSSPHFRPRSDFLYLAVGNSESKRFNNAPGGELLVDSILLQKLSRLAGVSLFTLSNVTVMTQEVEQTTDITIVTSAMEFLPETQAELFPVGHEEEDLIRDKETGEPLTMAALTEKFLALDAETQANLLEQRPTQIKAISRAVLAAGLRPFFPEITRELLEGMNLRIVNDNLAILTQLNPLSDEPTQTALTTLEGLLGLQCSLDPFPSELTTESVDAQPAGTETSTPQSDVANSESAEPAPSGEAAAEDAADTAVNTETAVATVQTTETALLSQTQLTAVAGIANNLSVAQRAIADALENMAALLRNA